MNATIPGFIGRLAWLWIVLGVLGVAYMALCPRQFHQSYTDFIAGVLAGVAVVVASVRPSSTEKTGQ